VTICSLLERAIERGLAKGLERDSILPHVSRAPARLRVA